MCGEGVGCGPKWRDLRRFAVLLLYGVDQNGVIYVDVLYCSCITDKLLHVYVWKLAMLDKDKSRRYDIRSSVYLVHYIHK